ncbi:hypothetical protein GCM10008955_33580 [Deinococcus malanensis]|uniref:Uncharacterized protein n=1 Tax=Deinococcus malanensis TaxID=1706855 RepID=A0ABQ2F0X6_9DEIO|nr:hypothetical protein [Deinococcus malanensis]GGK36976.1 hypothetical protein GCM10008955_33580 [Deinococcus malanensis]
MTLFNAVRMPDVDRGITERELRRLTVEVRAVVPDVAVVVVTNANRGIGVSLHDQAGHTLDMAGVPFSLLEDLMTFFGLGCWVLTGTGLPAARVRGV